MEERKNTIVCIFEAGSPRTAAFEVHEWLHEHLRIQEEHVRHLLMDGPRKQVYVKLVDEMQMQATLRAVGGRQEFKHSNGEISSVVIEATGLGTRKVRIATLAPEIRDATVRAALGKYGEVKAIREEQWNIEDPHTVPDGDIRHQGANLVRGAATNVLYLQRNRASIF
jgi:hypothetical protein